jgi:hypothetical protein
LLLFAFFFITVFFVLSEQVHLIQVVKA